MNTYFRYNPILKRIEKRLGKKLLKYDLVLENNDRIPKYNIEGLHWNISLEAAQEEADAYISERILLLRNAIKEQVQVYEKIHKMVPIDVSR